MINNITISIPIISTIRYNNIQAVKITGLKEINAYLSAVTYNNLPYIRASSFNITSSEKTPIFTENELTKSAAVELIQLNYLNEPDGNLSAIFTLGIIAIQCINELNKELNH